MHLRNEQQGAVTIQLLKKFMPPRENEASDDKPSIENSSPRVARGCNCPPSSLTQRVRNFVTAGKQTTFNELIRSHLLILATFPNINQFSE